MVFAREIHAERTPVYYDADRKSLALDTSNSGTDHLIVPAAPFELSDCEELLLHIFVAGSIIEVYVNEIQAACRSVFPKEPTLAVGASLIGEVKDLLSLSAFEIAPTFLNNFYYVCKIFNKNIDNKFDL